MKKAYKVIIASIVSLAIVVSCLFVYKNVKRNDFVECKSVAIISDSFYRVFGTAEENDTNYEYYYKSIKVKETKDKYIIVFIDWRTETKQEQTYDKSKWIVIVNC